MNTAREHFMGKICLEHGAVKERFMDGVKKEAARIGKVAFDRNDGYSDAATIRDEIDSMQSNWKGILKGWLPSAWKITENSDGTANIYIWMYAKDGRLAENHLDIFFEYFDGLIDEVYFLKEFHLTVVNSLGEKRTFINRETDDGWGQSGFSKFEEYYESITERSYIEKHYMSEISAANAGKENREIGSSEWYS